MTRKEILENFKILSDKDIKDFAMLLNDLVYNFNYLLKQYQTLQILCNSQMEILEKQRKIIEKVEKSTINESV